MQPAPYPLSLSEALCTPEKKAPSLSPLSTQKQPKLSIDLDSMLQVGAAVELPKVDISSASFCRGHAGPLSPPPSLPPFLPADAALSSMPCSPPPTLPASMPLVPAPAIEAVELPAPPTQPPALGSTILPPAPREEEQGVGQQPKLSLPIKMLRFDSIEELAADTPAWPGSGHGFSTEDEMASSGQGKGVMFPPGLQPPPNTPSHGSLLHGEGVCRPCAWFWKSGGCKNGFDCGHCHLCPEGEIKARKKTKQTIMRLGLATPKDRQSAALPSDAFALDAQGDSIQEQEEIDALLAAACAPAKLNASSKVDSGSGSSDHESSTTGPASEQDLSDGSHGSPRGNAPPVVHFPPGLEDRVQKEIELRKLPSRGSKLHDQGACKPCAWFWKPSGCQTSFDCKYCHACPQGELKSRKKSKHVIMRMGLATPKADEETAQKAKLALSLETLLAR